ncbi:MAG: MazG family protein [Actinomycetota bacterium]|nr:MazG family protein [Actinomycetota bacterium]
MLVVPLRAAEWDQLTLSEWDRVRSCERVLFEDPKHPLMQRLRDDGADANVFDDEVSNDNSGWALVADPGSSRVLDLARDGADVMLRDAPDALTAAHGASVARDAAAAFARLTAIMARLRSEDGCPWDREQTHKSLEVHLLEEAYEVLDAIDRDATGADLEEELGDLLLQVVFHAQLALDDGRFDIAGVARAIAAKLLHRHPHVFGDIEVADADEVVANWETIKRSEKERSGPFEGMPAGLPALLAAAKTQKRATSMGFAASEKDAFDAIGDALAGEVDEAAVGRALFWIVALARRRGIDPESALRATLATFKASPQLRP